MVVSSSAVVSSTSAVVSVLVDGELPFVAPVPVVPVAVELVAAAPVVAGGDVVVSDSSSALTLGSYTKYDAGSVSSSNGMTKSTKMDLPADATMLIVTSPSPSSCAS